MNVTNLKPGQNVLLLRYSENLYSSIIEDHLEVLANNGYVWYGKFSRVTRPIVLDAIFSEDNPAILLYKKGQAYLCDITDFSTQKPNDGYPHYYDTEYLCPTSYYKLTSIDPLDLSTFKDFFVRSSKRNLAEVFSKPCMASSLFLSYKEIKAIPSKKKGGEK